MVDYVGLGMLVIGSYVLIVYGPQIAANIQAGQAPLAGVVPAAQAAPDTTGAISPAVDTAGQLAAAPTTGTAPAPVNTSPSPILAIPFVGAGGGVSAGLSIPTSSSQPTTLNSPKTTSFKYTNQKCVPGTGPGTGSACVPIGGPNTRPAKKAVPPHATSKAKTCHGLKCGPGTGVTCGGLGCPQLDANVGYSQGYNIPRMGPEWYSFEKSNVYQANMTQVVNGKTTVSIDPYFPAGFYLIEAGRKASRHEPALH